MGVAMSGKIVDKIKGVLDEFEDSKEKEKFLNTYLLSNAITKMDKKIEYIHGKFNNDEFSLEMDQLKHYIYVIEQNINSITAVLTENLPEIDASRDTYIKRVTETFDEYFPAVEGDRAIQIGTVIQMYGSD